MVNIVLIAIAAMCGIGWLKNRVGLLALCHYMTIKNYPPPSDTEMKASSEYVVKRLLRR